MISGSNLRLWAWLVLLTLALMLGVLGDTSHAGFLAWSWLGLGVDKIGHMLYMGALATLMARRWGMWTVVIFGSVLALVIECVQPYFHRDFALEDAAWGIVGTWFAWGLYQIPAYKKALETKLF